MVNLTHPSIIFSTFLLLTSTSTHTHMTDQSTGSFASAMPYDRTPSKNRAAFFGCNEHTILSDEQRKKSDTKKQGKEGAVKNKDQNTHHYFHDEYKLDKEDIEYFDHHPNQLHALELIQDLIESKNQDEASHVLEELHDLQTSAASQSAKRSQGDSDHRSVPADRKTTGKP